MENVNPKEEAIVIDEQLEQASGGFTSSALQTKCDGCRKVVPMATTVSYNNHILCTACYNKVKK